MAYAKKTAFELICDLLKVNYKTKGFISVRSVYWENHLLLQDDLSCSWREEFGDQKHLSLLL